MLFFQGNVVTSHKQKQTSGLGSPSLGLEVGQVGERKQIFDPDVSVTFLATSQYYCGPYLPPLLINLQNCMLLIMLLLDIMLAIVHSSHFMHKQLLATCALVHLA